MQIFIFKFPRSHLLKAGVNPRRRKAVLNERQRLKMAESAHAYVRGNTARFYEWLESKSVQATLPAGPDVWICGDCHTGNIGPVADVEGAIDIQIRDLDQTVIGNPAHDLLRLGLSLAMAARSSDLPGVTTALMLEELIVGYVAGLNGRFSKMSSEDLGPIRHVMREARKRRWKHLAEERIEDVEPTIPLGQTAAFMTGWKANPCRQPCLLGLMFGSVATAIPEISVRLQTSRVRSTFKSAIWIRL